jgi:hypothetical protein
VHGTVALALVTAAALNDAGPGCGRSHNPYRQLPDEWAAQPIKTFVGKTAPEQVGYQVDLPGDWIPRPEAVDTGWETPIGVAYPPYVKIVIAPANIASADDALAEAGGSASDVIRKEPRPDGFALTVVDTASVGLRAIRLVKTPSGAFLECTAAYPRGVDIGASRPKLEAMCDSLKLK